MLFHLRLVVKHIYKAKLLKQILKHRRSKEICFLLVQTYDRESDMFNSTIPFKKPGGSVSEGLPYSVIIPLFCWTKKEMDSLSEAHLSRLLSGKTYIHTYIIQMYTHIHTYI